MYTIPDFTSGMGNPGGGQQMFGSMGGSSSTENQYMNFPSMGGGGLDSGSHNNIMPQFFGPQTNPTAQTSPPGIVPPGGAPFAPVLPGKGGVGSVGKLPGASYSGRTLDPTLTNTFDQWLMSQMGTGMHPFDLSAIMPSTGQATTPGTLTAPENPILQQLQEFYKTGQGGPLPGVLPMWQAEMQQMNIPIQQQLANIKEQFGARGALGSSEMAQALAQFGSQTAADENALLTQATQQALPGMEQFGMGLQQLDQQSIDALYQEFQRTQPQNNPLLGYEAGMASLFPPIYGKGGFAGAFGQSFGGALGSGLGSLLTGQTKKGGI